MQNTIYISQVPWLEQDLSKENVMAALSNMIGEGTHSPDGKIMAIWQQNWGIQKGVLIMAAFHESGRS